MNPTQQQAIEDSKKRKKQSLLELENYKEHHVVEENFKFSWEGKELHCSIIFSTATGVYLLDTVKGWSKKILSGKFYGITRHHQHWFFCRSNNHGPRGWVENERISDICHLLWEESKFSYVHVALYGIPKEVHQIDIIDNNLVFPHTDYNHIVFFSLEAVLKGSLFFGEASFNSIELDLEPTSHLNSVFCEQKKLYVIAHNFTMKTEKRSDLIEYDLEQKTYTVSPLNAHSAHNVYKNDELIYCDSNQKLLIQNGLPLFQSEKFLRGLSISDDAIFVGGSDVTFDHYKRFSNNSEIYILNRAGKLQSKILLPELGDIYEIRQFANKDYSMIGI